MIYVRIMVEEGLPRGSVKIVPRIVVGPAKDEKVLRRLLTGTHQTVYVPNAEVGERVRAIVERTEGIEEDR